jgi:RNA 2',3'-cyclic 3'-phosphodiesterase
VRLFVALEIPSVVKDKFAELMKELRASEPPSSTRKARWVRSENLHVTVKFIGEAASAKLEAVRAALSAVHSGRPVALSFRGLGFFPNENRARVLWAGMEASPNLASLAGDVDQALGRLGFALESRSFAPHLTLARFDPPGISRELRAAVEGNMTREFGLLRTGEFHLIESKLKPSGAEYTTLQTFAFSAEA